MSLLAGYSQQKQEALFKDMYYLSMTELRSLCEYLQLPKKGKKAHLVLVLQTYLLSGSILVEEPLPTVSCGSGMANLSAHGLILSGSYKNDQKTREFMKSLVGEHFHFTAWGQDWIKERWQKGKPPTFQEFGDAWQANYHESKQQKRSPKKEWAFLCFVQSKYPLASKSEILAAWKQIRREKADQVISIITALKL